MSQEIIHGIDKGRNKRVRESEMHFVHLVATFIIYGGRRGAAEIRATRVSYPKMEFISVHHRVYVWEGKGGSLSRSNSQGVAYFQTSIPVSPPLYTDLPSIHVSNIRLFLT